MTSEQRLETIPGDLRAYAQLMPETFQHADQLTKERIANYDLCRAWFHTADGNAYQSGKGSQVLWGMVRQPDNLILKHLFDEENSSFEQLVNLGNFRPEQTESDAAFKQAEVMDLTQFRLQGNDEAYRFLHIRTADGYVYDGKEFVPLKDEEKKGLNRVGFTDEYLAFLNDNPVRKIETTDLYVLNPAYVQKEAGERTIWRASWLRDFDGGSHFYAKDRNVYSPCCLRGVRRVGEANRERLQGTDTKRIMPYDAAFQRVVNHPQELDNAKAAELSDLVAEYLRQGK